MLTLLTTETHHYDGAIGDLYRTAKAIDPRPVTQLMTFKEAIDLVTQWVESSTKKDDIHLRGALNLLKNDHQGNYDPVNLVSVEDLLPRVVAIVMDFDWSGIELFLQNLAEIHELGACPQGRVTRLMGFYLPYIL